MPSTCADVEKVMQRKLAELRVVDTGAEGLARTFAAKLSTAGRGDAEALGALAAPLMLTAARSVIEELLALWAVRTAMAEP